MDFYAVHMPPSPQPSPFQDSVSLLSSIPSLEFGSTAAATVDTAWASDMIWPWLEGEAIYDEKGHKNKALTVKQA